MPSISEVFNRAQPARPGRWLTGTVQTVSGRLCNVEIDNTNGQVVQAIALDPVPAAGARVLIAQTTVGNFVMGTIG